MENKYFRLGIVVFANDSGLGNQTRRLTYMLKPYRILAINNANLSSLKKQHFDWYDGFNGYKVTGFPRNHEIKAFLQGLTHVLCCENPLNFYLFSQAERMGIKTYCQTNYEFCDNLARGDLPLPHKFLMPSYWGVDHMKQQFGDDKVTHLPPPIDPQEFREAREANFERNAKQRRRFVHPVGNLAVHDRNGTKTVLEALIHTKDDFELVIRSQHELPDEFATDDRRVTYQIGNIEDPQELYKEFDAILLPRRYGGLCLPMGEGLMSGLPVIMTDISPNDETLPSGWLVEAKKVDKFVARIPITVYEGNAKDLASKINAFVEADNEKLSASKSAAFDLGHKMFAPSSLAEKYEEIW